MKEWIKYTITMIIFVLFLNFWLIYQVQFSETTMRIFLIAVPTIISLFFVFRMLNFKKIMLRILISTLIVFIVTILNIKFRFGINNAIDYVSTDIEIGVFIVLLLYLAENIFLASLFNFIHRRLTCRMKTSNNINDSSTEAV